MKASCCGMLAFPLYTATSCSPRSTSVLIPYPSGAFHPPAVESASKKGFGMAEKGRDGKKGEDKHAQSRSLRLLGIKFGFTAALPALQHYKNVPLPAFNMQIGSKVMQFFFPFFVFSRL